MKKKKDENYYFELRESLKGFAGFLLYFAVQLIIPILPFLMGYDYNNWPIFAKEIYLILVCILEMFVFYKLYANELKKGWKDLKKNVKTYLKDNLKIWFAALALMYLSNVAIIYLRYNLYGEVGIASNEQTIRDTLKQALVYVVFATSLYAPFVEELTFRHSFRKIFKNKYVFVIVSSLVFGGLHVFESGMTCFDLLYLIPYCIPGVAFAVIYLRTKNPLSTISLHMIHNTILILLQVILLSKGLL